MINDHPDANSGNASDNPTPDLSNPSLDGVPETSRRLVKLVYDEEQPVDHGGDPVAPLTPAGLPFRYRLREPGRAIYASSADDMLSVIIDGYPEPPAESADEAAVDAYDEAALTARTLHAFGVITNHVATAIIQADLTPEQEQTLRRAAERGPDYPPITIADCPNWDADEPMILIAGLYHGSLNRVPPAGNVIFIDPGTAENYLWDLARLGDAELYENPAFQTGQATITTPHNNDQTG